MDLFTFNFEEMKKSTWSYIVLFLLTFICLDQVGGRLIRYGIERFYGLNQHVNILIIGHSHIMLSVNKEKLEKGTDLSVAKYTREGVNLFDRYVMVRQYLESDYSDSLKYVLYGVDQFSFVKSGLSENSYKLFYPFMDDPVMGAYVKESAEDTKDYYIHKYFQLSRYSDALLNASIRGYRNDYSNYKVGVLDVEALNEKIVAGDRQYARKMEMDKELLDIFDKTVRMVTDRGLKLILVNTPVVHFLKEYDPEGVQNALNIFQTYAESNPLVEYWDFNPEYDRDYSIFFDPIHLNPKGQELITRRLIDKMTKIHS